MKYAFAVVTAFLLAAQVAVAGYVDPLPKDRVCQRSCFGYKPQCEYGWSAVQYGDCWTCCRDPDYGYGGGYNNDHDNDHDHDHDHDNDYDHDHDNDYDNGYDNSHDNGYGN